MPYLLSSAIFAQCHAKLPINAFLSFLLASFVYCSCSSRCLVKGVIHPSALQRYQFLHEGYPISPGQCSCIFLDHRTRLISTPSLCDLISRRGMLQRRKNAGQSQCPQRTLLRAAHGHPRPVLT
ncbi:hypothetical protein EDB19DRAFT_346566 [Suillus lakei]|nr:hypothetical protein EDB19DRAFT_346566 [Suillus lakei]